MQKIMRRIPARAKKQIVSKMEKVMPVFYYRLLKRKREKYDIKKSKMSIREIQKDDDRMYFEHIGKHVDWNEPKAYTEKMQLEKIFNNDPMKSILADKYRVREWVSERIGESYLVPLCGQGVYNSPYEIDFSNLPNQFVIKTNAGSGDACIIKDKRSLSKKDIKRIVAKMDYYSHCNFAWLGYELHYSKIKPKIIIEQYIDSQDEDLPDYKFLCFDGIPYYCWVDMGRYHNHKRNVYDMNWNLQDWNQRDYGNYDQIIPKPVNFSEMVRVTKQLAKDFKHVRVDLYNIKGKIYFGEMTFTNGCGFEKILPYDADLMLGKLWTLDIQQGIDEPTINA